MKKLKIVDVEVIDIRVPTSDTLQGSDPFHKKPNWSCVYTSIKLDNGIEGLSVCFTSGAGNDWIAYGVRDIAKLFMKSGGFSADIIDINYNMLINGIANPIIIGENITILIGLFCNSIMHAYAVTMEDAITSNIKRAK